MAEVPAAKQVGPGLGAGPGPFVGRGADLGLDLCEAPRSNATCITLWFPPLARPQAAAADIVSSLEAQLRKLEAAVGSQQPDAVSIRNAEALRLVSELELLQAPGLPFLLPKDYQVG